MHSFNEVGYRVKVQKLHISGPHSDNAGAVTHCAVFTWCLGHCVTWGGAARQTTEAMPASKAMSLPRELPKPTAAWGFTPSPGWNVWGGTQLFSWESGRPFLAQPSTWRRKCHSYQTWTQLPTLDPHITWEWFSLASEIHNGNRYLEAIRMPPWKKKDNKNRWECGEKGTLVHSLRECKWVQPLRKIVYISSKN